MHNDDDLFIITYFNCVRKAKFIPSIEFESPCLFKMPSNLG